MRPFPQPSSRHIGQQQPPTSPAQQAKPQSTPTQASPPQQHAAQAQAAPAVVYITPPQQQRPAQSGPFGYGSGSPAQQQPPAGQQSGPVGAFGYGRNFAQPPAPPASAQTGAFGYDREAAMAAARKKYQQEEWDRKQSQLVEEERQRFVMEGHIESRQAKLRGDAEAARKEEEQSAMAGAEKEWQQKKSNAMWLTQIGRSALGNLPGVNGAANIIQAGIVGGPAGAAGAAAAQAANFAVGGAQKASPMEWQRMQYETDRLQAVVGQHLVPVISDFGKAIAKLSDTMGGKGQQLVQAQFSDFAGARDRIQMLAAQGLSGQQNSRGYFEREPGWRERGESEVRLGGAIPDAARSAYRSVVKWFE